MKDDAVALKVMLEEQRRLMRMSNRKLAELEETISSQQENEVELLTITLRYGDHARTCKINQGGNYYMEPVECDCGWEREMIALKLIERFNEQADDYGGHATDCIISIWERCPSPGDNLRKAKCDCGLDDARGHKAGCKSLDNAVHDGENWVSAECSCGWDDD